MRFNKKNISKGLVSLAILNEKLINDNNIIEEGTNLDRKQGLRTH